jgi:hypothetical protein
MAAAVPSVADPRWKAVLSGDKDPAFSNLATKLMVARLRQRVNVQPDEMDMAIGDLQQFFSANAFAARDLKLL